MEHIAVILVASLVFLYTLIHFSSKITFLEAKSTALQDLISDLQRANKYYDLDIQTAHTKLLELEEAVADLPELRSDLSEHREFVGAQLLELQESVTAPLRPEVPIKAIEGGTQIAEQIEVLNGVVFNLTGLQTSLSKGQEQISASLDTLQKDHNHLVTNQQFALEALESLTKRELQVTNENFQILFPGLQDTRKQVAFLSDGHKELARAAAEETMRIDRVEFNQKNISAALEEFKKSSAKSLQDAVNQASGTTQEIQGLRGKVNANFDKASKYFEKMDAAIKQLEKGLSTVLADQASFTKSLNEFKTVLSNSKAEDQAFESRLERLLEGMTTGQQVSLGAVASLQKEITALKSELSVVAKQAVDEKLGPQVLDVLKRIQALHN